MRAADVYARFQQQLMVAQRAFGERRLAEGEIQQPCTNEGLVEAKRGYRG